MDFEEKYFSSVVQSDPLFQKFAFPADELEIRAIPKNKRGIEPSIDIPASTEVCNGYSQSEFKQFLVLR
jgi:hypothetical protein